MNSFDFVHMKPDENVLKGPLPKGVTAHVLSDPGKIYAIYIRGGKVTTLQIAPLPALMH